MSNLTNFYASEATELHDYLDEKKVPKIAYNDEGTLIDQEGRHYYILSLVDRVIAYIKIYALTINMKELGITLEQLKNNIRESGD